MRAKETRSAKPQRARATARQLHGQAGIALPKVVCEGPAGLRDKRGPSLAQSAAARETSHATLGAVRAAPVLSPRYPLYSNASPWEELAVLHPPVSLCHDNLMMHEEEFYACSFAASFAAGALRNEL